MDHSSGIRLMTPTLRVCDEAVANCQKKPKKRRVRDQFGGWAKEEDQVERDSVQGRV